MGNPRGVRRDFDALEKRRLEAVRLVVDEGLSQSEAARRVKAAQQSVSRWVSEHGAYGAAGLRRAGRAGRKPLLDATQRERLEAMLLRGPEAQGFSTPLWTCPRVARLIADEFGVRRPGGSQKTSHAPQTPHGKILSGPLDVGTVLVIPCERSAPLYPARTPLPVVRRRSGEGDRGRGQQRRRRHHRR